MKSLKDRVIDIRDSVLAWFFMNFSQVMVKAQPIWDEHKILISISSGVVLGLIIGLILGWSVWPAKWVNVTPGTLREDFRSRYLATVAEEYVRTGDEIRIKQALGLDVEKAKMVPWMSKEETLKNDLQYAIDNAAVTGIDLTENQVRALEYLQTNLDQVKSASALVEEEATSETSTLGKLIRWAVVLLVLVIGALGAWAVINRSKQKTELEQEAEPESEIGDFLSTLQKEAPTPGAVLGTEPPVKSFTTTYVIGDDYFDPSFSIEIGPDFLGECGIGISETIGAGDPKKVTAFEAWLFDKSDIRTLTIVLASEYADTDPDLHAKLEPKGEIEALAPGQTIMLETTALRVQVQIRELEYAQGSPPNSHVQKATFELQAWVKANTGDIEV